MKFLLAILSSALATAFAATTSVAPAMRHVADIKSVTWKDAKAPGRIFDLEGWVLTPYTLHGGMYGGQHVRFTIEDETGADTLQSYLTDTNVVFRSGDQVRVKGRVTVQGEVSDVFPDEIDPSWVHLTVTDENKTIYIPYRRKKISEGLDAIIGCRIEATGQKDLEIVGEAEDGEETVRKVLDLRPDVVLMDLLMPKKDGIAHALRAGATGAVLKSADFSTLVTAIHTVADGGRVIDPEVEKLLKEDPPLPELTPRQEEILASVTRGLTNADIARQLGIRESSVKEHVNLICTKIGAANRAEAVAIAMRKHLLNI